MSSLRGFWRRNATTIALVVILCVAGSILYIQALATAKLQQQIEGQQAIITQIKGVTDQINTSSKQRTEQIDQLNKHLDCVVTFFTQKDRTQKAINDIETCTVKNTSTGSISGPKASSSGTTSTPAQKSSNTPAPRKISTPTQDVVKKPTEPTPSVFSRVNDLINKAVGVQ
jgi:hypothetical protein